MSLRISQSTIRLIAKVFARLDYATLGGIYCYEGGDAFWRARRTPCQMKGLRLAQGLIARLKSGGRSLYVGAGVAELPPLLVEVFELRRSVWPFNLRRLEVGALNRVCRRTPVKFRARDAVKATGMFDHLWIVSVLNDPERFPHLAPLSYGRADPVTFNPALFRKERRTVQSIVNRCMPKLSLPGLVTTSTEEVIWIADWCHRHRIPYRVERKQYATALVGDPICFVRVGEKPFKIRNV